jgi:hypothetical protein
MTSGAIQNGVPTKVFFLVIVADSCPETPKSANLTWPVALSKMFAARTQVSVDRADASKVFHLTLDISM